MAKKKSVKRKRKSTLAERAKANAVPLLAGAGVAAAGVYGGPLAAQGAAALLRILFGG